jgi:hypothetical protein
MESLQDLLLAMDEKQEREEEDGMLINHSFDEKDHVYHVPGEYVLATSDVIELNGMSEFGQVPPANLEHAGHRGTATHLAIMAHETGCDWDDTVRGYEVLHGVEVMEDVSNRMAAYFRFRKQHSVELAKPMEQSMVYRHVGTDALIGATPDMVAFINGVLTIVDIKTCFKQYGQKQKQLKLKWFAQLSSYLEALEAEEDFWNTHGKIEKAVLHLHPECGKERGFKPLGYEYHDFPQDGSFLWDSMIRVAQAKLSHGYRLDRNIPKTHKVPLVYGNKSYETPTDCEF